MRRLALLLTASTVRAQVELTKDNFAQASGMPVAWLLHLDSGAELTKLKQVVAGCGQYYNTLHPERDVRVGHVDLLTQPELSKIFCQSGRVCPPVVLLPPWSGGRGRLQATRSQIYPSGHYTVEEMVGWVEAAREGGSAAKPAQQVAYDSLGSPPPQSAALQGFT